MESFADININNQELLCWKTLTTKIVGPGRVLSFAYPLEHVWQNNQREKGQA
ncbi:hypothetical protein L1264_13595 [Pseudoalteromonas sp. APAL1]|uniref:hypothetical protein n=1 Tax=unclassified Pseudoalteromonas TaxID=194690 RepID=UPI0018F79E55|nr:MULTISPECIES: hypothetical protein [unclassified Pseudoalteromonas]MCF2921508.1 hypothetical protein [Pseudoalteromonas sp. APAL1]|tara:strand:+ start:3409 stop:3564 length:156 start_codon:yes stop_codon:yes gene_type:complete